MVGGVVTAKLDVLEDVLLDTLVLTDVEELVVVVGVDTLELDEVEVELLTLELEDVEVELLALEYVEYTVVVGVDTLELDVLDEVLLETLVLTLVDDVDIVVGVDTPGLEDVEVELLTLELDNVEVELLTLDEVEEVLLEMRSMFFVNSGQINI